MFAQRQSKETDTFNYGVVCFSLTTGNMVYSNPVSSQNVQFLRLSTWKNIAISQFCLSDCEMSSFCLPIVLHWPVRTSRDSQVPVCEN